MALASEVITLSSKGERLLLIEVHQQAFVIALSCE